MNHLIHEQSPYLQQHAHNPVDWYPWSEEAFAIAARDQKPIFLSIGYSTCHWCHVMERESFEDPAIAGLLNQWFVSVKVDREEHPDVDQVYMHAVMAMTGHGGWPLTVFLTPDRKPFFGGTYFPPQRRWNMPGLAELLPSVAKAWTTTREELLASAEQMTQRVSRQLTHAEPGPLTPAVFEEAVRQAQATFDPAFGGFGSAPKFPRGHELSFLLRAWARTPTASTLEMVTTTLEHLARGGIHDQLGGGFHRYSTDSEWLVPHFEKMLYDQALLAHVYLKAFQATGTALFAETARDVLDYVLRDLTDPQGGFYSAEDADSQGREGTYYVWPHQELLTVLGPKEGAFIAGCYGATPEGNFEGVNVLHLPVSREVLGEAQRLAAAQAVLLAVRSQRVRPHRDEKILTSWNGLMVAALSLGAQVLKEPRYLAAAQRAVHWILAHLCSKEESGRLVVLRRFRGGDARYAGTLEDYAFLSYGLLALFEASAEPGWLTHAHALAREMLNRFQDPQGDGLYLRSPQEEPLIASSKDSSDGATPSGQSIAALVLLKGGQLAADPQCITAGRRLLESCATTVQASPLSFPQLLIAWDWALTLDSPHALR
jgi:uncharacterized protein YyaL (SSP411 family)